MKEKKFEAACHLRVKVSMFNKEEKERLASDLKGCGYDIGDCFVNDAVAKYPNSDYLHIFTDVDGSVRRDDNGEYRVEIPDGTIDCGDDAYLFISIVKIKVNETLNCYFTNGMRWWLNRHDNPHFLAAAQRLGFHKATPAEILKSFRSHLCRIWLCDDPLDNILDMNSRMQGHTTRLVDAYVQELFNNAGEWISVSDHHRNGTKYLIDRLRRRMKNEHNIDIEIIMSKNQVRINPKDINFLK